MTQKKFVFRQLSRYICTRRIQFLLHNINVVQCIFFQIIMTLFAALFAGAKTTYCVIFPFSFLVLSPNEQVAVYINVGV